jgi:hypothetical protein
MFIQSVREGGLAIRKGHWPFRGRVPRSGSAPESQGFFGLLFQEAAIFLVAGIPAAVLPARRLAHAAVGDANGQRRAIGVLFAAVNADGLLTAAPHRGCDGPRGEEQHNNSSQSDRGRHGRDSNRQCMRISGPVHANVLGIGLANGNSAACRAINRLDRDHNIFSLVVEHRGA